MKRPVDEIRVARTRRKLAEHAREHPEAFERIELLSSPGGLAAALGERRMGRPPSDDPMLALTVRVPRSLLARLDEACGARNRGEVVRQALERWLRAERRRPRASRMR